MNTQKIPAWFWIIGIVALLWNLMGLMMFVMDTFFPEVIYESMRASGEYTEEQIDFMQSLPFWNVVFYGLATVTGTLGSIGLLMRKKWTVPAFLTSMISVVILHGYYILGTDVHDVLGTEALFMPILVITGAILLWVLSRKFAQDGYLK